MSNKEPLQMIGNRGAFDLQLKKVVDEKGILIYSLQMKSDAPANLNPIHLKWKIPAHNVKGVWSTNALHEKRLRADWEAPTVDARVSVDAPMICLFGHEDENIQTFACADVINRTILAAPVREEDNFIYCQIQLFTEQMPLTDYYETQIRIDNRLLNFGAAIQDLSDWWATFENLTPMPTFEGAREPLYSTWYSYHQTITVEGLLAECREAKKLGCELIIVDDGWQTMDDNRGYDYTGDWQPERIPNMAEFVKEVHALGMKFMPWFSVPFCGVKSKAYQQFKGKFLTENHRWAPVFDPRYPEVRAYLINIYSKALKEWNADGFKLDFIDDFKVYPETEMTMENGRDYISVNQAVDRLMSDVSATLRAIKSDVLIEFRQKYIGPAMRKYGNMFRAFDCPNDSLTNRIRTTDVKLLCGRTAVHSDMFTWHYDEPVEYGALQMVNILFSVPQVSVRLAEVSDAYREMIQFYLNYWSKNRQTLLDGAFTAYRPSANYPILKSALDDKIIYGLYNDMVLEIDNTFPQIDVINGKQTRKVVLSLDDDLGLCQIKIYNCRGQMEREYQRQLGRGLHALDLPPAGLAMIEKTTPSDT